MKTYEQQIDNLIPIAEKIANKEVPRSSCKTPQQYADRWNAAFHKAMNQLAIAAGLRRVGE